MPLPLAAVPVVVGVMRGAVLASRLATTIASKTLTGGALFVAQTEAQKALESRSQAQRDRSTPPPRTLTCPEPPPEFSFRAPQP